VSAGSKSKRAANQQRSRLPCPDPGCDRTYASQATLDRHTAKDHPATEPETAPQAAERVLATLEITPKLAVLAATVRRLASALESCEETDVAKTSKELDARMNDLLGAVRTPDEDDWTEE
jgi:hypothetical protein